MESSCIVCAREIPANNHRIYSEEWSRNCDKIFHTFCKFLSLTRLHKENPFNFECEVLPFCDICKEIVATLFMLETKVENIQKQIRKIVCSILKRVIQSTFENFSCSSKRKRRRVEVSIENDYRLNDKNSLYRNEIFKQYNPSVRISSCENNSAQKCLPDFWHIKKERRDERPNHTHILPSLSTSDGEEEEFGQSEDEYEPMDDDSLSSSPSSRLNSEDISNANRNPSRKRGRPRVREKPVEVVDVGESQFIYKDKWRLTQIDKEVYTCDTCQVVVEELWRMKYHIKTCHEEMKERKLSNPAIMQTGKGQFTYLGRQYQKTELGYECLACELTSEDFSWIKAHVVDCNKGVTGRENGKFSCVDCGKILRNASTLHLHVLSGACARVMRTHRERRRLFCKICKKDCGLLTQFYNHFLAKHPEVSLNCINLDCGNGLWLCDGVWLFSETGNSEEFQCVRCDVVVLGVEKMRDHVQEHPGLCCEKCGRVMKDPKALELHQYSHTAVGGTTQVILTDDNKFAYGKYKQWFYEEVEDGTMKCCTCAFLRKGHIEMREHLRLTHMKKKEPVQKKEKEQTEKRTKRKSVTVTSSDGQTLHNGKWPYELTPMGEFKCLTCGVMSKDRGFFSSHIRKRHEGPTDWMCEQCGKKLSTQDSYRQHMKLHSDIRPYKCTEPGCSAAYKTGAQLHSHKSYKHSEQTWPCSHCPKEFQNEYNWRRHQRYHSNSCPYECSICFQKFKNQRAMTTHRKAEHLSIIAGKIRNIIRVSQSSQELAAGFKKKTGAEGGASKESQHIQEAMQPQGNEDDNILNWVQNFVA